MAYEALDTCVYRRMRFIHSGNRVLPFSNTCIMLLRNQNYFICIIGQIDLISQLQKYLNYIHFYNLLFYRRAEENTDALLDGKPDENDKKSQDDIDETVAKCKFPF